MITITFEEELKRIDAHFETELISLREACKWLGCDFQTAQRDDAIPSIKIGSRYYISKTNLARLLAA